VRDGVKSIVKLGVPVVNVSKRAALVSAKKLVRQQLKLLYGRNIVWNVHLWRWGSIYKTARRGCGWGWRESFWVIRKARGVIR
jgi:hypothetical protein